MTQVSSERLEEMLAGLDKLPHGPWFCGTADGPNGTAGLAQVDNGAEMWPVIAEWLEATHIARCDPDTMRSIITELLSLRQSHSTGVVAWEGYWPGAGSIDSQTSLTRFKKTADEWQAGGAEVTPLYPHPKEAEVTVTEEMVADTRIDIVSLSRGLWHPSNDQVREILVAALSRKG